MPLTGTGFDFGVTASGSKSQTIASGQTASYTLVLTPSSSMAGTFTFQCGAVPANSVCSFNPTTESIAAGATGNVTVQIATGQSARMEKGPGWSALPLLCGLLLLPLAWRQRKALLLSVLGAVLAGGVCGCSGSGGGGSVGGGGGGGGGGSTTTTPAGTYNVSVTALSGAVQHSFTLTLVVD